MRTLFEGGFYLRPDIIQFKGVGGKTAHAAAITVTIDTHVVT